MQNCFGNRIRCCEFQETEMNYLLTFFLATDFDSLTDNQRKFDLFESNLALFDNIKHSCVLNHDSVYISVGHSFDF